MIKKSCLIVILLSALNVLAIDPPKASEACVACHGVDGNSITPLWPKIAGQHEKYLLQQLLEYKKGESGNRNNLVMLGIVADLNEAELAELSKYYSKQTVSPGMADAASLELGKKIYRGGIPSKGIPNCGSSCHGPQGRGNKLGRIPSLSYQHAEYTADQLKKYRSGERKGVNNPVMEQIAARMSDEEIEAVSNYVSGLH